MNEFASLPQDSGGERAGESQSGLGDWWPAVQNRRRGGRDREKNVGGKLEKVRVT